MLVRAYVAEDRSAVYDICLRTGDDGQDATGQVSAELMGDVWAGPYLVPGPGMGLVAEDAEGLIGYVIGTSDTRAFEASCERLWWPRLRDRYPPPAGAPEQWTLADRLAFLVHHPMQSPDDVVAAFPAHLHLNVLPRAQGKGVGPRLLAAALDRLRAEGVAGVHVGVSPGNDRANRFWERGGLAEVRSDPGVRWLGRLL